MRKLISLIICIGVLGVIWFLAFNIVSSIRLKSENAIFLSKLESTDLGESEVAESGMKTEEFSSETLLNLPQNLGSSVGSADDFIGENLAKNFETLDFSSVSGFLASYNNLVEEVDSEVFEEGVYFSDLRATFKVYSVGKIVVVEDYNGGIFRVEIKEFGGNSDLEIENLVGDGYETNIVGSDVIISRIY